MVNGVNPDIKIENESIKQNINQKKKIFKKLPIGLENSNN